MKPTGASNKSIPYESEEGSTTDLYYKFPDTPKVYKVGGEPDLYCVQCCEVANGNAELIKNESATFILAIMGILMIVAFIGGFLIGKQAR